MQSKEGIKKFKYSEIGYNIRLSIQHYTEYAESWYELNINLMNVLILFFFEAFIAKM